MKKCNIDRSHYLFDNQALVSLIVPLIIEQLLTVLVGMADSIMVANVGEAAVSGVRYGQLPVEAGNAGCDKTDADGICREGQEIAGIVGRIRCLCRIWHSVQMPDATLTRLIWPTLM